MKEQFVIIAQADFSAAHRIDGYNGACGELHGHNWMITVAATTHSTDEIGISLDMKVLKSLLQEIIAPFDHTFLNESPHFANINPTAENIARYIFTELGAKLDQRAEIDYVEVREGESSAVRYSRVE